MACTQRRLQIYCRPDSLPVHLCSARPGPRERFVGPAMYARQSAGPLPLYPSRTAREIFRPGTTRKLLEFHLGPLGLARILVVFGRFPAAFGFVTPLSGSGLKNVAERTQKLAPKTNGWRFSARPVTARRFAGPLPQGHSATCKVKCWTLIVAHLAWTWVFRLRVCAAPGGHPWSVKQSSFKKHCSWNVEVLGSLISRFRGDLGSPGAAQTLSFRLFRRNRVLFSLSFTQLVPRSAAPVAGPWARRCGRRRRRRSRR